MFAADAAAGIEAELQMAAPGRSPARSPRLIGAVEDQRVEAAVTGMENIGDGHALAQMLNGGQDPGRAVRAPPVLEVVTGELTAQG